MPVVERAQCAGKWAGMSVEVIAQCAGTGMCVV